MLSAAAGLGVLAHAVAMLRPASAARDPDDRRWGGWAGLALAVLTTILSSVAAQALREALGAPTWSP